MIYIFSIALTLFMAYIYQKIGGCENQVSNMWRIVHTKKIKLSSHSITMSIYFVLMIMPVVLVSGLRYGISVDYINIYQRGFYRITEGNISQSDFEIGFQLLVKACATIVDEPWFMFLVVALITIVIFFESAKKCSKNFVLSVSLFFLIGIYFDTFNGIRQYIAVALFVYSYRYIRDKRFWKFLIIMLIAGLFHTSAFFFIPVYWLHKININFRKWLIIILTLFIFSGQLINLYVVLLSRLGKYNEYIIRNTLANNTSFSLSGLIISIIAVVPCVLNEKKMRINEEGKYFLNMVMLGIAIASISEVLPLAERILYYFKGIYLISIPYALDLCSSKKTRQLLLNGIIILLGSMTMIGIIALNWYAVLPYKSIFNR